DGSRLRKVADRRHPNIQDAVTRCEKADSGAVGTDLRGSAFGIAEQNLARNERVLRRGRRGGHQRAKDERAPEKVVHVRCTLLSDQARARSRLRISSSRASVLVGAGGAAGWAASCRRRLLIPFTSTNITKAIM